MLIPISVYIVLAVSLNLVVGLLGELSLGHGGFLSVGLFSGCLVAIALSATSLPLFVRLPLSMIVGGLVAMVFGFIVGLPALRLKGDYLAIVTLACGEIIKNIITNLDITGGALGLNTGAIYSNAKTLLPYAAVLVLFADGAGHDEPQALEARPRHHRHPRQPHRGGVHRHQRHLLQARSVHALGLLRRSRRNPLRPLLRKRQGRVLRL